MRDTDIESYIRTRLGRANPIGRGEDVILPLLPAQKDRRASVREQVTSLFTDYGHGAAEREQGIPTPPRALSVAERLVAFQDFHAAVLSQKFRSSIGGIVRSHTRGVPSEAVEHSPLILRRSPLLESDLIRGYSLQGEKKTAWAYAQGLDERTDDHHYVPHTMGGTDSAPNIVELPKRFHATLHMMMANLPPHLGLLLVLSWSEYDQRTYERHEKLREDIYDLYRDLGRGRTELEDIYNPKTLHGIAGKPQDGGKNPRVKEDGLRILRNSLRIGRDW